ncbi:MAG TPA: hypothetical protein VFA70_11900, partial [Dehalococcoidia bacterium]|nr:hypothetical protein [Dehalococcoidia bacterium]
MPRATIFVAQNDQGQRLLDDYILPLCRRLSLTPDPVAPRDRGVSVAAQVSSQVVIWDGSVETGHVYHAFNEMVKNSKKDLLVSRTPLPRNVLAYYQCAPRHGSAFTNADLGEWLEIVLPALVRGQDPYAAPLRFSRPSLASHYWMRGAPAKMFISFRGSHKRHAERWANLVRARSGLSSRIVPDGEYAYERECVTRQQMWEVIARISHELDATKKVAIVQSDDYFDSFWTCSELLVSLRYRSAREGLYLVRDANDPDLHGLPLNASFPVPVPTAAHAKRVDQILNNADPLTVAPDTRYAPTNIVEQGWAWLMNKVGGYYDPEFTGDRYWTEVLVQCPHCRPHKRQPHE